MNNYEIIDIVDRYENKPDDNEESYHGGKIGRGFENIV